MTKKKRTESGEYLLLILLALLISVPGRADEVVKPDTIFVRDTVYLQPTTVYIGSQPVKKEKPLPVPADQTRAWAVKTNLALWGVVAPNLEIEYPIGEDNRWSIEGEYFSPWFRWSDNTRAKQCLNLGVEVRRWLGERQYHRCLDGWHVGLAFAAGYYNLEWKRSDGYQGEYINPYVNIGYQYRFGRNWAMDFGLGVGCLLTKYRHYLGSSIYPEGRTEAHDNHLVWQDNGHYVWFGPNHVNISFVYLINWKSR